MVALGNRFESLLINAREPLEKSKKKPKKRSEGKEQGRTKKPQSQAKKSAQNQPQAPSSQILSKRGPKTVPVKHGFLPTTKVIITDLTPTKIMSAMLSDKPTNVVVKDITPPKIKSVVLPLKPTNVVVTDITSTKIVEKSGAGNGSSFHLDLKSSATGTYQKMMKRIKDNGFEYNGPHGSNLQPEKRHGNSAYYWGQQLENTATGVDFHSSVVEQQTLGEGKEECVPVTLTLEQYKKLVDEKKVDPLSWSDPSQKSKTVVSNKSNTQDYEHNRGYYTPSGRGGRRFSGPGPSRLRSGPTTPRNHQTTNVDEIRERVVVYDIKVDDTNDFPDLRN
ncbi:hypothetical protein RF11_09489 [Thelohanellus kitauei]|uniref:Uncharacterized protein n=1 Tax=Thelohanellus kitauei TaxID=669202 RepID=A0A0C2N8S6_THEKT|nr:hypothetical protein RF11_09489 [Thelohanellus kitauei]